MSATPILVRGPPVGLERTMLGSSPTGVVGALRRTVAFPGPFLSLRSSRHVLEDP